MEIKCLTLFKRPKRTMNSFKVSIYSELKLFQEAEMEKNIYKPTTVEFAGWWTASFHQDSRLDLFLLFADLGSQLGACAVLTIPAFYLYDLLSNPGFCTRAQI